MFIAAVALTLVVAAAQNTNDPVKPEVAVLKAGLGGCSADFTVKGSDGKPVYAATIHVRVRYGVLGVKRSDLEVGTNIEGRARIEGLPDKARPLTYDVTKDDKKATIDQDVASACTARLDVVLK